jgi:hypothetical protein
MNSTEPTGDEIDASKGDTFQDGPDILIPVIEIEL